jgi:hypothetical protein
MTTNGAAPVSPIRAGSSQDPDLIECGLSTGAVHRAVRVNVTCVTPLGEEAASIW